MLLRLLRPLLWPPPPLPQATIVEPLKMILELIPAIRAMRNVIKTSQEPDLSAPPCSSIASARLIEQLADPPTLPFFNSPYFSTTLYSPNPSFSTRHPLSLSLSLSPLRSTTMQEYHLLPYIYTLHQYSLYIHCSSSFHSL